MKAPKARRPRRVPERTCVACRSTLAKRELVRVVRTPEGQVVVDPTGRKNGRGAYVHQNRECWDLALRRGVLERALKVSIEPEARVALEEYTRSLPATPAGSEKGPGGQSPTGLERS